MTAQSSSETAVDREVQDKYVARLRARLARPKITVEDARDGMLDCFVSTYHTGVKQGLKGIIGVNASPDQVAQVASRMFRDRLAKRGFSFENPSIDALNDVKEEIDQEFHFSELPAEVSATHDQVCSLLLAKADGLIEHHGDQSVVGVQEPASTAPTAREIQKNPAVRTPAPRPDRTGTRAVVAVPPPAAPIRRPIAPTVRPTVVATSPVTDNLRLALAGYLGEVQQATAHADPVDLLARLDRARSLAQSIADFSR
ncbi:MAG: hypothetical protein KUG77_13720 [Nannocystaceae bacterium]|nr:hypothetical protein [Nannocystaceae bacterium]